MRAPSVLDVAREARVSPSTVSRALNGTGEIAPETRARILAACEALGYTKNSAAAALRGRPSRAVAALMPSQEHERFLEKIHALRVAAGEAGFDWRLESYRDAREGERLLLDLVASRPAALILSGLLPDDDLRQRILEERLATVLYDSAAPGWDEVILDREAGSAEAVRHLLVAGKRRILLLGASLESERGRGWRRAHEAFGLAVDTRLVWDRPYPRNLHLWGLEQGRELASLPGIDGVFAVNDAAALGVLRALHEAGRRVPEEVAVIGLDGIQAGEVSVPSLTTVEQPCEAMARAALELLVRRRGDFQAPHERRLLAPFLRVRESA
ncbi:MAG: LacI family DNA-binding transcriptional regulator [Spirochaetes bacterium]|nr:LacI family DNA-binding transcriptional regulator [Spirochaetota bacterium]